MVTVTTQPPHDTSLLMVTLITETHTQAENDEVVLMKNQEGFRGDLTAPLQGVSAVYIISRRLN